MSIKTWIKEFYPIRAEQTHRDEAIDHSLQKWLGLLPENLEKHGVELFEGTVYEKDDYDQDSVDIDGSSCSLCHHYLDHDWDEDECESACTECPLYQARGARCDDENEEEWTQDIAAPWHAFTRDEDPKPMVMWLTKTKEANP